MSSKQNYNRFTYLFLFEKIRFKTDMHNLNPRVKKTYCTQQRYHGFLIKLYLLVISQAFSLSLKTFKINVTNKLFQHQQQFPFLQYVSNTVQNKRYRNSGRNVSIYLITGGRQPIHESLSLFFLHVNLIRISSLFRKIHGLTFYYIYTHNYK